MTESALYSEILRELSHGPTRLLRVNAGMAYQGRVVERTRDRLILSPWYPIRLAVEGVSDLLGWTSIDAADGPLALFVAIEAKGPRGRLTPEQSAFLDLVRRSGGRGGGARSVEDARRILRGDI